MYLSNLPEDNDRISVSSPNISDTKEEFLFLYDNKFPNNKKYIHIK